MWSNKAFRYTIISIVSVLVVGYIALVLPSIDTYYPGTIINGKDYSFKSPAYVDNDLYKSPSDYNLEIKFRDRTETINGRDIGLSINYLDELNNIKKDQNPFVWPKLFFDKDYVLEDSVNYNEDELDRIVASYKSLDPENMEEPQNPKIIVNDDGDAEAVYEDLGSTIEDVNAVVDRIKQALVFGETSIDIEEEGFYKMPEYTIESEKVQKCVNYCNTIASLDIEYKYGKCEIPLSGDQLLNTIKISDSYGYTISKDKVHNVVESFSRLYDTYGTIRTFKTHDRQNIKIKNGDYGWKINIEEETDNLYQDLIHRNSVTREPAFEEVGYCYDEEKNDIGGFYCEVDIENQHMYVYRSGRVIMQSDVVTGNIGLRRGTPTGIYGVDYKQTPAVLKGDDYETDVTYWMPFNGGVGFHDATWRGSFGGEIYKYNGSHGCVNLPYSFAQELFGTIEENMPVIVY